MAWQQAKAVQCAELIYKRICQQTIIIIIITIYKEGRDCAEGHVEVLMGSTPTIHRRSDEFKYQISSAINWPMLSDSFTSSHKKKPDNHCRNNNNYCETHIVIHDYKICRENIKVNVGMVGLLLLLPCWMALLHSTLEPRERYSADIAIFTVPSRRRCWPFIPSASHSTPTIVHIFSTLHTTPTSPIPALVKVQGIVLHRFIFFLNIRSYSEVTSIIRETLIFITQLNM